MMCHSKKLKIKINKINKAPDTALSPAWLLGEPGCGGHWPPDHHLGQTGHTRNPTAPRTDSIATQIHILHPKHTRGITCVLHVYLLSSECSNTTFFLLCMVL